ncbi:MAG TPA: hypothetical protein V6D47_09050, partial [Oscillatoriaceae cyanobacterium]
MALPLPELPTEPAPQAPRHGMAWLGYLLAVCLFTFPLAIRFTNHIAGMGDSPIYVWELWWFHHALFELHTNPLVTNLLFYPTKGVPLVWPSPYNDFLGLATSWLFGPVLTYNLLVTSGLLLAAYGAYRLAFHVIRRRDAAFLAGLIYAFAPAHMEHVAAHLNVMSVQWAPYCVWALFCLYERPTWRRAALFGVALALASAVDVYVALYFLIAFAPTFCLYAFFTEREKFLRPAFFSKAALMTALAFAVVAPAYWPMLQHIEGSATAVAQSASVGRFGQDVLQLLVPPPTNPLLGALGRLVPRRMTDTDTWGYIGYTVLALAVLGLRRGARHTAVFFGLFAAVSVLLAFGVDLHVAGVHLCAMPYALLSKLPLLDNLRCPGRFMQVTALALAVLAAMGAAWWFERLGRRAPWALAGVLVLLLVEFLTYAPFPTTPAAVPPFYAQLAHDKTAGALLELPNGDPSWGGPTYMWMYYQTQHGHPLVVAHTHRIPDGALDFIDHT